MLSAEEIALVENLSVEEGIKFLTDKFPAQVVFSTSLGQEDQVINAFIGKNNLSVKIFTLDTGRLYNESYDLLEKTTLRYKTPIEVFFPDATDVQEYVNNKGINAFYESVENRKECCFIRKVKPLNRALQGAKVWITGLRAEQSENRKDMPMVEWDEQRQLYKYNPLLHWTFDEMTDYIKTNNVPYNPLHDKGFVSIGCAPCTRAIEPGEDVRAGRWWWELSKKECGLHSIKQS
jgi:phosphoadenosine phosphosulfate reductase